MDSMRKWFHGYVGEVNIEIILRLHVVAICGFEDNRADISMKESREFSKGITSVLARHYLLAYMGSKVIWGTRKLVKKANCHFTLGRIVFR